MTFLLYHDVIENDIDKSQLNCEQSANVVIDHKMTTPREFYKMPISVSKWHKAFVFLSIYK